jgi:hypothetical protein
MARFFNVTAVTTSIELDATRTGQAAFTVTNATSASIRGDAVVMPEPGAETAKYDIDEPSRHFGPGATDQLTVKVTAPAEMAAGTYGFRLRMLLGGGVPEEQFDDGPTVKYTVSKIEEPPPPPPPPPKKPFPWWIVAVIVAVIAIIVIGGIVAFVVTRPKTGTIVVITRVINDNGRSAAATDFSQHVLRDSASLADFAGAAEPGVSKTITVGQYQVTQDPLVNYGTSFSADCTGELAEGQTKTCTVANNDFQIIVPTCPPICIFIPPVFPPIVEPINPRIINN